MNISRLRWLGLSFVVLTLTVLLTGCVLGGGGYYDGGYAGATYYEPSGVVYGGWGHDYHVAPPRGGEHRADEHRPAGGGGHEAARAYRPAPASRSMPSIPSQPRAGGSRSR